MSLLTRHVGCTQAASSRDCRCGVPNARPRCAVLAGAVELLAGLELAPEEWDAEVAADLGREVTGPDAQPATLLDAVITVRRRGD